MRLQQILQNFRNYFKAKRHNQRPKRRSRRQLQLEQLEERTTPTVLFVPQSGAETANPGYDQVVSTPWGMPIYTIFWGSYWGTTAGANLAASIEGSINSWAHSSHYLDGLHQYGVNYPAGVNSSGTVEVFDYSDPGNPFNNNDVFSEAAYGINGLGLPTPNQYSNPGVYFVITAPGANFVTTGVRGYHNYGNSFIFRDNSFETFNYGWISTNGSLDSATSIISHETIDTMTDPNGYSWQVLPRNSPSWNELCDNEAQNYGYRINGYLVQSFWSQSDGAYAVYDGNSQNMWVNNGVLNIYGDQLGAPYDDSIYLDENGSGGVYINMNSQIFSFDPGQISSIHVYAGGGSNTINIYNNNVPIYIQSAGTDAVSIGNGSDSVQGIKADVHVTNTSNYTLLYVHDGGDPVGQVVTVTNSYISGLAPGTIYYNQAGLEELYIYGGSGGNYYDVSSTPTNSNGGFTYLSSGNGSGTAANAVDVTGTNGTLLVDGGAGTQLVCIGSNGGALGGTLAGIKGSVAVYNTTGTTSLYVDDSGDSTGQTMNISTDHDNNFYFEKSTDTGMPNSISWSPAGPGFGGVTNLLLYGGTGFNTFNFYPTASSSWSYMTNIFTGTGGAKVDVQSTVGGLSIFNQGGLDYVNVGSLAPTIGGGTLANINGDLQVFGPGQTYLYIDDSGDSSDKTVSMYDGRISGLTSANIYWEASSTTSAGVDLLDVFGGTGRNTFNVYSTSNFYFHTYLDCGGGFWGSGVYVQSTSANGASGDPNLIVDGAGGVTIGGLVSHAGGGTLANISGDVKVVDSSANLSTYLYVDDSGDSAGHTVSMYDGKISGLAPANILWSDGSPTTGLGGVSWLQVFGGTGANIIDVYGTSPLHYYTWLAGTGGPGTTVNVRSTSANGGSGFSNLSIDALSGPQTVTIGSLAPALGGTLAGILGDVDVYGGATITLNVDDSGDSTGRNSTLTSNGLSGLAQAVIYYATSGGALTVNGASGNDTLTIVGTSASTPVTFNVGAGNDTLIVESTSAGGPVTFNGGGGSNTLVGPYTDNTWNITATNVGNVGNVTFANVQNLIDSGGNDLFHFSNGAGVTGAINGNGVGTLDYSAYLSGVTVNLLAGTATGTGGVANVHNVTGSPFNDTITCDNVGDVIHLNGGKDLVKGGAWGDVFFLGATQLAGTKITGGGSDTLVGPNTTNTWTINGPGSGNLNSKVTFTGIANLGGGTGNDTYKFTGATASLAGIIFDNGGTNKLDYSHYTGGPIFVNLANNAISLVNGGAAAGFFGAFSSLAANSAVAGNTLIGPDAPYIGPAAPNNWSITGANAGKVVSPSSYIPMLSFAGIQNLVGGSNVDVFKFSAAGTEHSIDGGGGGNWLDYSGFASPVAVNLATGSATNVNGGATGSISNIQNVHGGNAGNTLTGDAQGNILIGGLGGGSITGGTGRSILIADKGSARITGGSTGGDILIGDYTTFDTMTSANEAALAAILAEWQSGDLYADRFADINQGLAHAGGSHLNGSNVLKWGTTVKDNGLPDAPLTVTAASASGIDWFFLDTNDATFNFVNGDHKNNT